MNTPVDPASPVTLQVAHCGHCGAYSYPASVYGCRVCGLADRLAAVPLPAAPTLRNFVTLHAELAPGLPVPCVIGEVELAPGVVEEALIAGDEGALSIGVALVPERESTATGSRWRFVPVDAGSSAPASEAA